MGTITMERIDFFLAPQQPGAAPVANNMSRFPHADCQGHEHGADSHGKDDECDRTQLELDGGAGPDFDRAGVQFAEITIEKDSGADKKYGDEQSEHRTRPLNSRMLFSVSRTEGRRPVLWPAIRPGWRCASRRPTTVRARNAPEHPA